MAHVAHIFSHILMPIFFIVGLGEDGLLVVTSFEDAQRQLVTRHFAVRDLLNAQQPVESASRLMSLIVTTINHDSWRRVGGQGLIDEYQGVLVVTQTDRTQDEIKQLIDNLRKSIELAGGANLRIAPTNSAGGEAGRGGRRRTSADH